MSSYLVLRLLFLIKEDSQDLFSYMRFSRYALIWLFISHPTTRLFPCVRIADESSFFNLAAACSPTLTRSTIGRLGLNRRVRDGYGCSPQAHRHQKYFELLTTQQRNTHPLLVHFHRKEVIQPHLPIRLPCYDFTPVTGSTFDCSLPDGLGHRLRAFPAPMV